VNALGLTLILSSSSDSWGFSSPSTGSAAGGSSPRKKI